MGHPMSVPGQSYNSLTLCGMSTLLRRISYTHTMVIDASAGIHPTQPFIMVVPDAVVRIGRNDHEGVESDDDMTIIGLDHDPEQGSRNQHQDAAIAWIERHGPEIEERRRNLLLRELQHVQRVSFVSFMLLCLIPTTLFCVLVATVLGDNDDCSSGVTACVMEARTFLNAFTTRCICDAVNVSKR